MKKTYYTKKTNVMSRVELQSPIYNVLYDEYDKLIKAKNFSLHGKGQYQTAIREFFYWLEQRGVHKITRIDSGLMIDYFEYLCTRPNKKKEGTLSDSMINQHLFSLRLLFDYLLETGQIESSVLIPKNNPGTKKERNSASLEEIDLLYKACENKLQTAILSTAYGCGLRRAEMKDLNTNDINFANGILVVREGKNRKRRDVPMSDAVIRDLKNYLIYERPNYLKEHNFLELAFFINQRGKRMKGGHMNDILKALIDRTKNATLQQKEISLHCLRHSIAEHLADKGADIEFIRDFLGHEGIDTSSIYSRKNKQKQKLNRLKQ
jgi:integrase/recombinase XerD